MLLSGSYAGAAVPSPTKLLGLLFSLPKTYEQVLQKLALYLFVFSWLAASSLRSVPQIGDLARALEAAIPQSPVLAPYLAWLPVINLPGALIAGILAWLAYVVQLHDRISDLFRIRQRFDTGSILLPLAALVGATLSASRLNRLRADRDTLMRAVFYRFASSSAEKPLVDPHDIQHALSAWSWFWIMVEGSAVAVLGFTTAVIFGAWGTASLLGGAAIVAMAAAMLLHSRLERYARPQIERIASDEVAAAAVRDAFNAL
jgi:hypothetical protein